MKKCSYFGYECHHERQEGSIFCSVHRWLVGVFASLLGFCVLLSASAILSEHDHVVIAIILSLAGIGWIAWAICRK